MTPRDNFAAVIELRSDGPVTVGWWEARNGELWGVVADSAPGARRELVACAAELAAPIMAARGALPVEIEQAVVVGLRLPRLTPPRPVQVRRPARTRPARPAGVYQPRVLAAVDGAPALLRRAGLLATTLLLLVAARPAPAAAMSCHEECKAYFTHCLQWAERAYEVDVDRLGWGWALRVLAANKAACLDARNDCCAWCEGRFSPATGQIRPIAVCAPSGSVGGSAVATCTLGGGGA